MQANAAFKRPSRSSSSPRMRGSHGAGAHARDSSPPTSKSSCSKSMRIPSSPAAAAVAAVATCGRREEGLESGGPVGGGEGEREVGGGRTGRLGGERRPTPAHAHSSLPRGAAVPQPAVLWRPAPPMPPNPHPPRNGPSCLLGRRGGECVGQQLGKHNPDHAPARKAQRHGEDGLRTGGSQRAEHGRVEQPAAAVGCSGGPAGQAQSGVHASAALFLAYS